MILLAVIFPPIEKHSQSRDCTALTRRAQSHHPYPQRQFLTSPHGHSTNPEFDGHGVMVWPNQTGGTRVLGARGSSHSSWYKVQEGVTSQDEAQNRVCGTTLQEVKRGYDAIGEKQGHAIFVGEQDGQVVALLHLYERPAFDKPPELIVQALVVDQNLRGTGIGKAMMNMAESWASDGDFPQLPLHPAYLDPALIRFIIGSAIKLRRHLSYSERTSSAC
jgi:GNAT superfamily N-acetyltransferase